MLWFVFFLIIIFLVYLYLPCRETYSDFSFTPIEQNPSVKRGKNVRFVPQRMLPPGFEEIDMPRHYGHTNMKNFRLHNQEEFCKLFPQCSPCGGSRNSGPPECVI